MFGRIFADINSKIHVQVIIPLLTFIASTMSSLTLDLSNVWLDIEGNPLKNNSFHVNFEDDINNVKVHDVQTGPYETIFEVATARDSARKCIFTLRLSDNTFSTRIISDILKTISEEITSSSKNQIPEDPITVMINEKSQLDNETLEESEPIATKPEATEEPKTLEPKLKAKEEHDPTAKPEATEEPEPTVEPKATQEPEPTVEPNATLESELRTWKIKIELSP
jgi:hypothetical protein